MTRQQWLQAHPACDRDYVDHVDNGIEQKRACGRRLEWDDGRELWACKDHGAVITGADLAMFGAEA